MSMADQNPGVSARLRSAREQQGLAIEALARELKNPVAVLEAIERGEWARLGAPVFARHLVGRYASRLGVAVDLDDVVHALEVPQLRSQVPASRVGRFADFSARHAVYAGGTLLVVPLVYTLLNMTATGPVDVRPLDPAPVPVIASPAVSVSPDALVAVPMPGVAPVPGIDGTPPAAAVQAPKPMSAPSTVAASLGGGLASSRQIELRFTGDSWIEVFDRDGGTIERVLARDGEMRRFEAALVGRVTIGNVEATEVLLDGSRVNLEAVRAANVARFALSSDGSIEAVTR